MLPHVRGGAPVSPIVCEKLGFDVSRKKIVEFTMKNS